MRYIPIGIAALAMAFATPAPAQTVEGMTLMFCDTADQVARVVTAANDVDTATAVAKVNAELKNELACAIAPVFFVRGKEVARATNKHGTFAIVLVAIVGLMTDVGPQPLPAPLEQLTAFKVEVSPEKKA